MDFNKYLWNKLASAADVTAEEPEAVSEDALWQKLAAETEACKCAEGGECKCAEGGECKCAEGECDCISCGKYASWDGRIFNDHNQVDAYLSGHKLGGGQLTSVQNLVSPEAQTRLNWPPVAGTKVAFSDKLDALLAYRSPPEPNATGNVVCVRTAAGDSTHQDGQVFVKWDTGDLKPVHREHLSLAPMGEKQASSQAFRIVASDLGDLSAFFAPTSSGPDLVHKATQDLWSFKKSQGEYILERLFDASGEPVKV